MKEKRKTDRQKGRKERWNERAGQGREENGTEGKGR